MKTKINYLLAAGSAVALIAGQAFATPVEITRKDYANLPLWGFNGGPFVLGADEEDNETEAIPGLGTIRSQSWDLEAFTFDSDTTKLNIVGGYNFSTGQVNGTPGDLFIKIGTEPGAGWALPVPTPDPQPNNAFPAPEGYTYVVDLSSTAIASGSSTRNVYLLNTSSLLYSVTWDQLLSNPWKYASGGTLVGTTTISYTQNQTAYQVATLTGANSLTRLRDDHNDFDLSGIDTSPSHNVLKIDLSFLNGNVPPAETVWFSYTMQCGNDIIKGSQYDNFDVPDGGATAVMIGIGLSAMYLLGLKRRHA